MLINDVHSPKHYLYFLVLHRPQVLLLSAYEACAPPVMSGGNETPQLPVVMCSCGVLLWGSSIFLDSYDLTIFLTLIVPDLLYYLTKVPSELCFYKIHADLSEVSTYDLITSRLRLSPCQWEAIGHPWF